MLFRSFRFTGVVGVPASGLEPPAPHGVELTGAWPNPSRGEVRIGLAVSRGAEVRLTIEDVGGRRVRTLLHRTLGPGSHVFAWDGRDDTGARVSAGVYLCRASDGASASRRKISLLR